MKTWNKTITIFVSLFFTLSVLGAGTFIKGPTLVHGQSLVTAAAGTTTLTKDSETYQIISGSTTQTFVLPNATTLPLGRMFRFINGSTGTITINMNGGSLSGTVLAGQSREWRLTAAGSAAGTWVATRIVVDLANDVIGILGTASGGTGVDLSGSTGLVKVSAGSVSASTLVNADVSASAAIARNKLAASGANTVLINGADGLINEEAQLAISRGGTGQATATAAFDALSPLTTQGDLLTYSGANNIRLPIGGTGNVLTVSGGNAMWLAVSGTGTVTSVDMSVPTFFAVSGNPITGAGTLAVTGGPDSASEFTNCTIAASISSNTLVLALKDKAGSDPSASSPCRVGMRSATATTGTYSQVSFTAANSITLGTTDSIGLTASVARVVHTYLIEDGTDEVCASASILNEGILQSATALTGGAEVTATTLYCPSAHTSRPIRYIGSVHATWSNPNWGSITDVSLVPSTRSLMRQVFTADGTWTAPKGVFNATVCGRGGSGGGGGGSGTGGGGVGKGGMGGGGAATTCRVTAITPNTAYAVTLGTAGTAGTGNSDSPGTDGGSGGDTTFGSLLTFKGAVGGLGASSVDASSFFSYQSAGYGIGGGGHGGHGGTSGSGSASGYRSTYASGGSASGGDTYDGGGGGGGDGVGGAAGNANGGNGSVGTAGGGGGGGAGSSIGSAGNGAAGTLGQLEVLWVQ